MTSIFLLIKCFRIWWLFNLKRKKKIMPQSILFCLKHYLGCTDATPEEPHLRLTRRDTATREGRRWPCVRPRPATCFFFSPIRADAAQTQADSRRFGSYRLNIGVFRPEKGNRPVRRRKKKRKLKTENTSGFDTPLSPSSPA